MSIHAIVEQPPESDEKRGSARWRIRLELPNTLDNGQANVVIHDISTDGMLIETKSDLEIGQGVAISLPEADKVIARVVWQNAPLFGCRFEQPLPQAAVSAVRLRNPTRERSTEQPSLDKVAEALPHRLRRLRQEQGLSRTAMSAQTGFSKPTIWGWETGRTTPRSENLRILAGIFSLTEQQLLFGERAVQPIQSTTPTSHARSLSIAVDEAKSQIAEAAGVAISQVHIHIEL